MSEHTPECLTEQTLLALLEGRLTPAQAEKAHHHIDGCPVCRALTIKAASLLAAPPDVATDAATAPAPARQPGLQVGQRVGPYQILRPLGRGSMGVVFAAVHQQIERVVAIKILRHSSDPEMTRRIQNEARAASRIGHSGIVNVHEIGQLPSGEDYIVMELVDGERLGDRLRQRGRLPAVAVRRLCHQIAAALSAAHGKGIVHRDLKPDNIMLVPDPLVEGGDRVKLLDFGLAKLTAADEDLAAGTGSGVMMGTPRYMAPEQCGRAAQVDGKADVYALGVVIYEMLSGRPPFVGSSVGEIVAMQLRDPPPPLRCDEDPALGALCLGMLSKDPAGRPTMADVAGRLSVTGSGPRPAPAVGRIARRWWRLALASVLSLGTLAWLWVRPPGAADGMVRLTGGTFRMGSAEPEILSARLWCQKHLPPDACPPEIFARERPQRMVTVRPFRLDRTEVTIAAFARWLNRQPDVGPCLDAWVCAGSVKLVNLFPGFEPSFGLVAVGRGYQALPGFERRPMTQITWDAAQRYCQSLGQRLPTEAEWEYAARGAEERRFPWGAEEPACAGVIFGRKPGLPCQPLGVGPGDVGQAPQDRTPEGVMDLGGNVSEWVQDHFRPSYPACPEPCVAPVVTEWDEGVEPAQRVFRGGGWNLVGAATRGASRSRFRHDAGVLNVGFRCAAAP